MRAGALRHRPGRAGRGDASSRTTARLGPRFGKRDARRRRGGRRPLRSRDGARARRGGGRSRSRSTAGTSASAPDGPAARGAPGRGLRRGPGRAPWPWASPRRSRPTLRREALAREVVHAVQGARRAAGLRVEERIRLHLDGSGELREAIEAHRDAIAAETLAERLTVGHGAPFAGRAARGARGRRRAARPAPGGRGVSRRRPSGRLLARPGGRRAAADGGPRHARERRRQGLLPARRAGGRGPAPRLHRRGRRAGPAARARRPPSAGWASAPTSRRAPRCARSPSRAARATVDLGPKIMQGTNGEGLNARLVQLVYTATGARA